MDSFAKKLIEAGYNSCEVCFNCKKKRKGLYKWLEDNKIIKPKTEGFALMIRDWNDVVILSSSDGKNDVITITDIKVNGIR